MSTFEKVTELIMLATLIDERTEYCVFIRYSGHVGGSCEIDVRKSKSKYHEDVFNTEFKSSNLTQERYEKIKSKFIEILETKQVDLSSLNKREIISYEYYL